MVASRRPARVATFAKRSRAAHSPHGDHQPVSALRHEARQMLPTTQNWHPLEQLSRSTRVHVINPSGHGEVSSADHRIRHHAPVASRPPND